jgi:small conductance mechanosensitive channel
MTAGEIVWKVLIAGLILVIGGTLGSWAQAASSTALEHAGIDPVVRRTGARLVRPLFILIALVAALEYLDIDLTTVAAMTGAATLAVGLALQHSLSNVASGAVLMTLRPLREGEIVECAGEQGVLLEHGTFALVIERADGTLVTVPNHAAFTQIIRNHSRRGQRRVELPVLVAADTDVTHLRGQILPVVMSHGRVLENPPPSVEVTGLEGDSVRLLICAWTRPEDHTEVRSSLAESLLSVLRHKSSRARVAS